MTKYRKKPVVIDAVQWFKNGDHPEDNATAILDYPNGSRPRVIREGNVVSYYKHDNVEGYNKCKHCDNLIQKHGWIDTLEGGHIVCPGDYIITGIKGERYPCKPDIFEQTYEEVK